MRFNQWTVKQFVSINTIKIEPNKTKVVKNVRTGTKILFAIQV